MKSFKAITEMFGETTIKYSRTFDLFGITFAIHHPSHGIGYVVSELATGMLACPAFFMTMAQAKKEGTKFLEGKGEEAVKKAISKGRRINERILKKLNQQKKDRSYMSLGSISRTGAAPW